MSSLLDGLTTPQRDAVTHTTGPLLVLAGAGSGKTRVITRRAAHLASTVTSARHVLAITFTNKAANEMKERIAALGVGSEMLVCTFHSLCARLLRWFCTESGLGAGFSIFDEGDSRQAIKQAISELNLSTHNFPPAMVRARISEAKNQLITAQQFSDAARDYAERHIARIYAAYEQLLATQQAVDFDDLLLRTAFLLGEHPHVRDQLEDMFRFVLIDEYQDTNRAQYMIARGLTLTNQNICATGDPDQSIYAWRGADIRNILEFEEDFPDARTIRLEQNYRSTKYILSAASLLIKANYGRKEKELWTENDTGARVRVFEVDGAEDEADLLVEEIQAHLAAGGSLNDIAIFYRVNALTRVLEETFLRGGISYQIARGTEFYNRKEIKDLLAYLRLIVNPADQVAFVRAITTPSRGIGKTTVARLQAYCKAIDAPILDAARRVDGVREIKTAAAKKIRRFTAMMDQLVALGKEPLPELVNDVFEASTLKAELSQDGRPDQDALDNISELISAAADFANDDPEGTLADWLQQISLVSDVDNVDASRGAVTLMTLHAAKGLEFPKVYIIAVEDGLLPHARYKESVEDLEEERRLCFVGMTRAMKQLTLSHARWRTQRGMVMRSTKSQFLAELPSGEIEWLGSEQESGFTQREDYRPRPTGDYSTWKRGMYLRHPSYGVGQLLSLQRGGRKTHAVLRFPSYGEKTLILEYAKLQPLDPDECQL